MIREETLQKISQVASVCIRCRRCMKECIMLNRFAENPKVLFQQYLEKGPENMDRHIAYSCNECSQCTLKCPKGLNLKAVFQCLKEDYAEENRGIVPVAALLPSELWQEKECSPGFCTALTGGSSRESHEKARYLFVPGRFPPNGILSHLRACLGQNNVEMLPVTVLETMEDSAKEAIASSEAKTLITACPSSYGSLKEAFPHRKVLFYWDLMADLIGIPGETLRADASLHLHGGVGTGVHRVLDQLGCSWEETTESGDLKAADQDCRQVLGLLFGEKNP